MALGLKKVLLLGLCILLAHTGWSQSVLAKGTWARVEIDKSGVYVLTGDQLRKLGFNLTTLDPTLLAFYTLPGGMLPQPNATFRYGDLQEMAILIDGVTDGKLDRADKVIFYASGPDAVTYSSAARAFRIDQHLYSRKNYVYVTVGSSAGKRIQTQTNPTGEVTATTFPDYVYHEISETNLLHSGREWYGERFDFSPSREFEYQVPNVEASEEVTWISDVMTQAYSTSQFRLSLNGIQAGTQVMSPVPNTTYGLKGRDRRDTLRLSGSTFQVGSSSKLVVKYDYDRPTATGSAIGFIDNFQIAFIRKLQFPGSPLIFRPRAEQTGKSITYRIANATQVQGVWDVTNPLEPKALAFNAGSEISVDALPTTTTLVAWGKELNQPVLKGAVPNQNLQGLTGIDYLLITPPEFITQATRLAAHREARNNWTAAVITTDEIYHAYSSGRQDVVAIRDAIRKVYQNSGGRLKAVLLFGKGSYNYLATASNTNYVPIYESRSSLQPLETYGSDDFYGFMEESEGNWGETFPVQNHTLDVGVGRIPVKSLAEAKTVVDKLIEYDQQPPARWNRLLAFVADDGSTSDGFTSIHQSQANSLADELEIDLPGLLTDRIFLGLYPKVASGSSESIPKVQNEIIQRFNAGTLLINFTGHGSERVWTDERVFTNNDIINLKNSTYPFLVTATCEFGRHDDPADVSSAELTLLQPAGGSIGLVTTARPVNSPTNFALNRAFYSALETRTGGKFRTMGEIFRDTKNNSLSGVGNRNFSLMGDPALNLAIPEYTIPTPEISTASGTPNLGALAQVTIRGTITTPDNEPATDFNGTITLTLYDKVQRSTTIGKNDPAFSFTSWKSILYQGTAQVVDGEYTATFTMPRSLAYSTGLGKLVMFASDSIQHLSAMGATTDLVIGGTDPEPVVNEEAPVVSLAIAPESYLNATETYSTVKLNADFEDDFGISVSEYGIGNSMKLVLDGTEYFVSKEYYATGMRTGKLEYTFEGLAPGIHTVTLEAWDVHNNPGSASLEFKVTNNKELIINELEVYPVPISGTTTFSFSHNRPFEVLTGEVEVLDVSGAKIMEIPVGSEVISGATGEFSVDLEAYSGKKLLPGLYVARLKLRSTSTGAYSFAATKLIVSN